MRILIAEDDPALAAFLRQGLEAEHYAVDVASEGEQARNMGSEAEYDLVILDLNLPRMDGISVLRHLRLKRPSLPVLVLTQRSRVEDRVQCLDTGADDYVPKQLSPSSLEISHIREDLIAKIKAARNRSQRPPKGVRKPPRPAEQRWADTVPASPVMIALGTSTGGPKALQDILPALPEDLSAPLMVVQHMPPGFTAPFAERLNKICALSVREATHGEVARAGHVYIAPAGLHMTVKRSLDSFAIISLSPYPDDQLHVPSVDVLMQSVAAAFQSRAMGIIMTGMGSDGALGMRSIHREGGLTIGQDEDSCAVYGMPRACAEMGILHRVVPLAQIPLQIIQATRYRKRA